MWTFPQCATCSSGGTCEPGPGPHQSQAVGRLLEKVGLTGRQEGPYKCASIDLYRVGQQEGEYPINMGPCPERGLSSCTSEVFLYILH